MRGTGHAADLMLERLPVRRVEGHLVRCVPQLDFGRGAPPSYFFASGTRNRCNPKGVDCLYFSEDESTANHEYSRPRQGLPFEHQPKLVYTARVELSRMIDLADPRTVDLLGVTEHDLFGPWLRARSETRLQALGAAVARQQDLSAIRFPSSAARAAGCAGFNVAIFPGSLHPPDFVEILGDSEKPLGRLP